MTILAICPEMKTNRCVKANVCLLIRSFLVRAYPTMKAKNPHTPILIREAMDIEPKVWARFEYGKETKVPLKGRSSH